MELETRDEGEIRRMPVGIRAAIVFLRLMVIFMLFPLVGWAFGCVVSLGAARNAAVDFIAALIGVFSALGIFMALLATAIGCEWMLLFLRARHSPQDTVPTHKMPPHPAYRIGLPLIQILYVYSIFAVCVWLVVKIGDFALTTWAWPVFWSVVAVGAHYGIKVLKRHFEGRGSRSSPNTDEADHPSALP